MHVTDDIYVSETKVEFTFSDGSTVALEEVRPACDKPYFAKDSSVTVEQVRAISSYTNLAVI